MCSLKINETKPSSKTLPVGVRRSRSEAPSPPGGVINDIGLTGSEPTATELGRQWQKLLAMPECDTNEVVQAISELHGTDSLDTSQLARILVMKGVVPLSTKSNRNQHNEM